MEKFAVEAIKAQRDQQIKDALRAKVPWTDLMERYDLTLAEIIEITERLGPPRRDSDILDARDEGKGVISSRG